MTSTRWLVLLVLLVSLVLLIPGLFAPVLTIRGVLTRDGIAQVAPTMLQRGLNDDTLNALKAMMNPTVIGLLEATGGDLRQVIIDKVTPALTASLLQNVGEVEVFQQTRSIVGSVRRLYEVGSPVPATLILLFSVVVPFVKTALVGWAMFVAHGAQRRRTLAFVEAIAKWSMADVFVVALFITYLAAMASQSTPAAGPPLVAFRAEFGAGFYWFAALLRVLAGVAAAQPRACSPPACERLAVSKPDSLRARRFHLGERQILAIRPRELSECRVPARGDLQRQPDVERRLVRGERPGIAVDLSIPHEGTAQAVDGIRHVLLPRRDVAQCPHLAVRYLRNPWLHCDTRRAGRQTTDTLQCRMPCLPVTTGSPSCRPRCSTCRP